MRYSLNLNNVTFVKSLSVTTQELEADVFAATGL